MKISNLLGGLFVLMALIGAYGLFGWLGLLITATPELLGLAWKHWELRKAERLQAKVEDELRFRAAKPAWRSLPWNG